MGTANMRRPAAKKATAKIDKGIIAANGKKILADKGVTVYTPTAPELAQFRSATQPPVIEFLKTKIDPKLIDGIQAAVKDAESKK